MGVVVALAALLASRSGSPATRVFHVPTAPTGLAADRGRVWVALPAAGAVWVLDASGRRVGAPIATGGTPARLALDAGSAWVADTDRGAVVRVRAGRPPAAPIPAGPDITDVAAAGGDVWTASSADGAVRRLAGGRATIVAHAVRPVALAAGGGRVVAADAGARALLRLRPAQPPVRLGGMPVDVALAGHDAWVADAAAGVVRRVDLATGRPDASIAVGRSPIAVAADARAVYVLCRDDRTLVRIDPGSGHVRERVELPDEPAALALDADHVWIAAGQHDIVRVDR